MKKFSVLMSVYYKESPQNLDLSLESILVNQTRKPDEVVLVKDGKLTKELDEVVEKYKKNFDKILKIVPLKTCGGLGNALNKGLAQCKYDIVARMDSDDVSVEDRFEKQMEFFMEHPEASAVGGYIGEFNDDPNESLRLKKIPLTQKEILDYAKLRNPMNHVTVCFKKNDILSIGGYMHLLYLEDHYLWARLLANGKVLANMPKILVKVRVGNGFSSRRGSKDYIKGWKFLQNYMHKNKLINWFQKKRNIMAMYVMVYQPKWLREFMYNNILRSKGRVNLEDNIK